MLLSSCKPVEDAAIVVTQLGEEVSQEMKLTTVESLQAYYLTDKHRSVNYYISNASWRWLENLADLSVNAGMQEG